MFLYGFIMYILCILFSTLLFLIYFKFFLIKTMSFISSALRYIKIMIFQLIFLCAVYVFVLYFFLYMMTQPVFLFFNIPVISALNYQPVPLVFFDACGIYIYPFAFIFIFITTLAIIYSLAYNINETYLFSSYCVLILIVGFFLFQTDSLIIFFLFYEMLLIPSFLILYTFAKTKRCIEAAYLMFFWTQFGALFLIFAFIYVYIVVGSLNFKHIVLVSFNSFELNFLFSLLYLGFGVKLPVWPFYGWLPKAHVEASTNFSIFLSGVLVKFAFFGLFKCLFLFSLEPTFIYAYPALILGLIDSSFKLFYQIDLKKLVAYSTVVEMHWLTICALSGQSAWYLTMFCMLISHAFLSTNAFFFVDAVNRRVKTRLTVEISGINFLYPKLFLLILINLLIFLGFPGTLFFIAEFLFFTFFLDFLPFTAICIFFLLYFFMPTFFFKSWVNVIFGLMDKHNTRLLNDINKKECFIYSTLIIIMIWLGFTWQSFLF